MSNCQDSILPKNQNNKKESSTKSNESQKFLNKKRQMEIIQKNYLIRRILTPNIDQKNEYEKIGNFYYLLNSLNWENYDSKIPFLDNFRESSFWFFINSQYFPYVSNELIEKKDLFYDVIKKYFIERQSNSNLIIKKNSPENKKIKFFNEISHNIFINNNKNIQIEEELNNIENLYNKISKINQNKIIKNLQKKFILTNNFDFNTNIKDEYLLMDMEYHSKSIQKFIDCIKNQNKIFSENNNNFSLKNIVDPDDVLCKICNDGDYQEDNLIVYCSQCQITVHQNCYGIPVIPKDDWTCQMCLNKNKNIECILCPCKGGAMKMTLLKKSNSLYKNFLNYRNEDNLKKISNGNDSDDSLNNNSNSVTNSNTNSNNSNIINNNNNLKHNLNNNSNNNEHCWVHMSCALWIPEVEILNYESKDKIKIDNINKKRYNEMCEICLKNNYGPTVKCEKCNIRFHVECARINNFQLDITENNMLENKFHIYCQKHAPHKLVKKLELNKQRAKDDIIQFSKIIEKNVLNFNRNHKDSQLSVYNKIGKSENININIKLSNSEKKIFMDSIRNLEKEVCELTVFINKDFEIIDNKNNNINNKLSYIDIGQPFKFPWYLIRDSEAYLNGMKPKEIFRYFKSICFNEEEYNKIIHKMNKNQIIQMRKEKNKIKQKLYCYCKNNNDKNKIWIECNMKDKCINNGWYHQECLNELNNFSEEFIENCIDVYYCPECRKKYNLNCKLPTIEDEIKFKEKIKNLN